MYMYILYIYVHIYACMGVCVSICISLKREKPRCNISLLLQQCYIKSSHKTQWFTTKKTYTYELNFCWYLLSYVWLCWVEVGLAEFSWVCLWAAGHIQVLFTYIHISYLRTQVEGASAIQDIKLSRQRAGFQEDYVYTQNIF